MNRTDNVGRNNIRFWTRRSRTFVALVSLILLATGCGSVGTTSAGNGSQQMDRDATLRIAWTIPAPPFDPHTSTSTPGAFPYLSLVYDRLTQVVRTPQGPQVEPMVAKSWEYSHNGTVVTFQLREDVTFHDGTPLTAKAVQLSLERALTLDGSTVDDNLVAIDRVEVVDKYAIRMHLTRPAADLPFTLATTAGAVINPTAIRNNGDLSQNPAGSGPYKLVELRLGDRAIYKRYEDYWDTESGKVARIEVIGITDDTARLNALRSGQIDAMMAKIGQYDQVSKLADDDQFAMTAEPPASWYSMYLNTGRKPLGKLKVRRALNYAINRQAINSAVLNGQCQPTSQPLRKGVTGHASNVEGYYSYKPAKARRLLAQAGVSDGFTLNILVGAGFSPQVELAKILQAQLGKVGVNIEIRSMDFGRAVSTFGKGRAAGFVNSHTAVANSAVTLQDAYLSPNFPGPLPEGYKQLVHKAFDPTLDRGSREQLLRQASAKAARQALDLYICAYPAQFAYDSNVVGLDQMSAPMQGGPFDLRYVGKTIE